MTDRSQVGESSAIARYERAGEHGLTVFHCVVLWQEDLVASLALDHVLWSRFTDVHVEFVLLLSGGRHALLKGYCSAQDFSHISAEQSFT